MAAVCEFLTQEGTEKYKNACYLHDEASKTDPENEPYKSKYKAREIYHELKASLKDLAEESPENDIKYLTAVLDLKLGYNYTDTDELSSGQSHLESCVQALEAHRLDPKATNILQHAMNQIGYLWTGRRKPDTANEYLAKAESLYKDYSHEVGSSPLTVDELFAPNDDEDAGAADQRRSANFEHTYTLTLYYRAQVLTQLGESSKAAEYCHVTLRRQLDTMKYEPLDWSLNAATLSQYYITAKKFKMARHCLASATTILKEMGEPSTKAAPINADDSQADIDAKEKMPRTWADMFRCWAKYGMALLDESKTKMLEEFDDDEDEDNSKKTVDAESDHNADKRGSEESSDNASARLGDSHVDPADVEKAKPGEVYFNLEVTAMEEQISDKYARIFDEARPVFLAVQKWLLAAKEFYVIDGHCTDHVEIIQDYSNLFKQLAFYELDMERQCKMHKRRVDMLEEILKELNPQHYMLICRQLMFEIAETYSNILDLKLAKIEEAGVTPSEHAVKKINSLCTSSIKQFQEYVDTLQTAEKVQPKKYTEDDERPALIAHFHMGRLFSKYLQFDIPIHLQNIQKTIGMYQYIVDYCKRNPQARRKLPSEAEICEEMVQLLPHKMERIRQRGALL